MEDNIKNCVNSDRGVAGARGLSKCRQIPRVVLIILSPTTDPVRDGDKDIMVPLTPVFLTKLEEELISLSRPHDHMMRLSEVGPKGVREMICPAGQEAKVVVPQDEVS